MAEEQPPGADQDPPRFDPWSGNHFGGARFFAASTAHPRRRCWCCSPRCRFTVIARRREDQRQDRRRPGRRRGDRRRSRRWRTTPACSRWRRRRPRQAQRPAGPVVRNVQRAARCRRSAASGPKLGHRSGGRHQRRQPRARRRAASAASGGSFGDYVGGLRKVGLDLVLVIDTTESMQFVIDEVKEHASALVADLQRMVPTAASASSSIATRATSTSPSGPTSASRPTSCERSSPTSPPPAAATGKRRCSTASTPPINELSWRKKSKKIIILIGGSPPHPEDVDAARDAGARVPQGRRHAQHDRRHRSPAPRRSTASCGTRCTATSRSSAPPKPEFYKQVTRDLRRARQGRRRRAGRARRRQEADPRRAGAHLRLALEDRDGQAPQGAVVDRAPAPRSARPGRARRGLPARARRGAPGARRCRPREIRAQARRIGGASGDAAAEQQRVEQLGPLVLGVHRPVRRRGPRRHRERSGATSCAAPSRRSTAR